MEKPTSEIALRQGFKVFNRFMLLLWRLGLGPWMNVWPPVFGRIMVLGHVGRKTGISRKTPVNYSISNGSVYCIAGFGQVTDWYRNIVQNPNVELWLPDGWWQGVAQDISESPTRLEFIRQVIIASGFAGFAAGLNAYTMSDEDLDQATKDYKLIRVQRTEARTGSGGPGDLSWAWPAIVFSFLALLPFICRRKRG